MKKSFFTTVVCGLILLATNMANATGVSAGGGGTPLKYIEVIQNLDKRIIVVDDTSFISIIGLMDNKETDFTTKSNINLDGLLLNKGTSYISAFRNTDSEQIYFINNSSYEDILKKYGTEAKLLKDLDFGTDITKLTK